MASHTLRELLDSGMTRTQIHAKVRAGEWTRLRRAVYLPASEPLTPEQRHRELIEASVPIVRPGAILSHGSAGVLWGLPVPRRLLGRVHFAVDRPTGAYRGGQLHIHSGSVTGDQVTSLAGLPVTGLVRTAVDLCRLCRPPEALAVMDAALRVGAAPGPLADQVTTAAGCHGVGVARWALGQASPLAESPGESICRYWLVVGGVPAPVLQYEVRDAAGVLLGRADFAWPERGVLGEFDGRIKYADRADAGESAVDVVMREKQRENRLRAAGWWVLRWTWEDLRDGPGFARRLRGFLADAGRP